MGRQKKTLNVLIGGEAGQGLQTVGDIFAKTLVRAGYSIFVSQEYESRVRGGHNTFAVRFGPEKVLAAKETIDLIVALNSDTVKLHRGELEPGGLIVADKDFKASGDEVLQVPYKDLTEARFTNVVALGVTAALLGLDRELVMGTMKDTFGESHPEMMQKNRDSLDAAYEWTQKQSISFETAPPKADAPKRLMMHAHEAVALGAISGGVKFCSFYPMSPSTSVPVTLIKWAKEMGLVVEQVEDEIAAINMALGASYAGAPALVPTSGGGFALMTEGFSLAGITETPVVLIIGQRPGPATGLATRTEQGDLWFVIHGGHGEFPRAVFAPGTIEECFHLTRKAVELAERFQTPTVVLTDHFMSDSYRDILPIDAKTLSFVKPGVDPSGVETPYKRYKITESGVSPRLLPGRSEHLVVADSHEHTEDGHYTENLPFRPKMEDKRLRKEKGLRAEAVPPTYTGPEKPDILLVSWGSTKGAADEAAILLADKGKSAATLHFSQVWPLKPDQFVNRLKEAKRVVGVESNATGQFALLIQRETGFVIEETVLRYDGLPLTTEYILRALDK